MNLRLKNIVYSLGLISLVFLVWFYRNKTSQDVVWLKGQTMGNINYNIKYFKSDDYIQKAEVDSILSNFNQSLSTYIPDSEISRFNQDSIHYFEKPYFYSALKVSKQIYHLTDGAFDPSISPLIDYWGFGPGTKEEADSTEVDSLKQYIGMEKIIFDSLKVWKLEKNIRLSFSASAKGFAVDILGNLLKSKEITNYFIEIGGEILTKGINLKTGKPWRIGILHPDSKEIELSYYATADIDDISIATSGNYFNYHVLDGVKYGHTISPKTGFPIQTQLLSASVFAKNCHEADALATAFMVMGKDESISWLENHEQQYSAFLIFSDRKGNISHYCSPKIKEKIKVLK